MLEMSLVVLNHGSNRGTGINRVDDDLIVNPLQLYIRLLNQFSC